MKSFQTNVLVYCKFLYQWNILASQHIVRSVYHKLFKVNWIVCW
jgi:hypothetical protein